MAHIRPRHRGRCRQAGRQAGTGSVETRRYATSPRCTDSSFYGSFAPSPHARRVTQQLRGPIETGGKAIFGARSLDIYEADLLRHASGAATQPFSLHFGSPHAIRYKTLFFFFLCEHALICRAVTLCAVLFTKVGVWSCARSHATLFTTNRSVSNMSCEYHVTPGRGV